MAQKDANLGEFSHSSSRFLHVAIVVYVGQSCREPKSIIMCPPKPNRPFRVTWPLVRLLIYLRCDIQVPLPRPRKPPAWPQANNIISGAAAKCGVEELATTGALRFACAARPPQEPPEENAPPAQRGPRREFTLAPVLRVRSSLHR